MQPHMIRKLQHESDGMLCNGICRISRDVGNSDPQISSCFYIDVVIAGRCAADVFQLRAVFHQFACDGTFTGHEDLISCQAGKSLVF